MYMHTHPPSPVPAQCPLVQYNVHAVSPLLTLPRPPSSHACRTVVSASLSGINSVEYSFVENEDDIFMT